MDVKSILAGYGGAPIVKLKKLANQSKVTYTPEQKASAVKMAKKIGATKAADSTGISRRSIVTWMEAGK